LSEINRKYRLPAAAAVAATLLLVTACASTPTAPPSSFNVAKLAIEKAQSVDANHYANSELDEARQKLKAADQAFLAENMVLANRYAQESIVTAELASARTEEAKAQAVNAELNQAAAALLEEMQRTGDQQ
jgi:hypothetical protein